MADDKKKKKSKKESAEAAPAAAPEPAADTGSRGGSRGSKKAKRAGSNVFSMFSQSQVAEFKEGFAMMDADKDGIIGKNDLRQTFDIIGKLASDKELDDMLGEAAGPISFTQLLTLFGERMSGSGATDDDNVVVAAFKVFDNGKGKIDGESFRHALMTWGDKFGSDEVDDAYEQMTIDNNNMIDLDHLIGLLTAKPKEEEGGEGEAA